MRMFRCLIFGGLAVLAAAFCTNVPAMAADYGSPGYSLENLSFEFVVPDAFKVEVITVGINELMDRSTNSHAVEYICQNQPYSAFRQSADAYQHIDPHIHAA